jgi:hypothetical protein
MNKAGTKLQNKTENATKCKIENATKLHYPSCHMPPVTAFNGRKNV